MSDVTPILTDAEVMAYLGIDYADDMVKRNIERYIKTADRYLVGAIGDDYPRDDSRAKDLALIVISDLYDLRGIQAAGGGTVSPQTRRLVDDFSLQLRLELRRAKEASRG